MVADAPGSAARTAGGVACLLGRRDEGGGRQRRLGVLARGGLEARKVVAEEGVELLVKAASDAGLGADAADGGDARHGRPSSITGRLRVGVVGQHVLVRAGRAECGRRASHLLGRIVVEVGERIRRCAVAPGVVVRAVRRRGVAVLRLRRRSTAGATRVGGVGVSSIPLPVGRVERLPRRYLWRDGRIPRGSLRRRRRGTRRIRQRTRRYFSLGPAEYQFSEGRHMENCSAENQAADGVEQAGTMAMGDKDAGRRAQTKKAKLATRRRINAPQSFVGRDFDGRVPPGAKEALDGVLRGPALGAGARGGGVAVGVRAVPGGHVSEWRGRRRSSRTEAACGGGSGSRGRLWCARRGHSRPVWACGAAWTGAIGVALAMRSEYRQRWRAVGWC